MYLFIAPFLTRVDSHNNNNPKTMSLVANYSGSESEHSASEDDEDTAATAKAATISKSDKTQSVKGEEKSINFLTAEFSESESEGEFILENLCGYRMVTSHRPCRCRLFWFGVVGGPDD